LIVLLARRRKSKVKAKVLLASLMILITSCVFVVPSHALDLGDIVGVWLFDEGSGTAATDSSGNGLDGEVIGTTQWVAGKSGTALDFAGADGNYVTIPHQDVMNLPAFTITAWVNLQEREAARAGHWQVFMIKQGDDGQRNYSLMATSPGAQPYVGFSVAGTWPALTGTTLVIDEAWHHVAGTYDEASGFKLYVDGVLDSEAGTEGPLPPNTGPILIANNTNFNRAAQGIIDEVGLFSTALTEDDIRLVMTAMTIGIVAPVQPAGKLANTWGRVKTQY